MFFVRRILIQFQARSRLKTANASRDLTEKHLATVRRVQHSLFLQPSPQDWKIVNVMQVIILGMAGCIRAKSALRPLIRVVQANRFSIACAKQDSSGRMEVRREVPFQVILRCCLRGTDRFTAWCCITGACTACPAGTYKDELGPGECKHCPHHSISMNSSSKLTDCSCKIHFTGPDGGPCTQCAEGFFNFQGGSAPCSVCGQGAVAHVGGVCRCDRGYTGPDDGECVVCPAGKYKAEIGHDECTECSRHSWSVPVIPLTL